MEAAAQDRIKVSRHKDVVAIRNGAHWLATYGGCVRRKITEGDGAAPLRKFWRYDQDWSGAQTDANQSQLIPEDDQRRKVLDKAPFRALLPKFFARVRALVDECHQGMGIEATSARAIASPFRFHLFRQSFIAADGLIREEEVQARAHTAGYEHGRNVVQDFDGLIEGIETQTEVLRTQPGGDPVLSVFGVDVRSRWLEDVFLNSSPSVKVSDEAFGRFEPKRAEFGRVGQALVDAVGQELIDRQPASFRPFPHLGPRPKALFRVLVIDDFYPLLIPWFDRMGALEPWEFHFRSGLPLKLEMSGERVRHGVDLAAASAALGLDQTQDPPPYHVVLLDIDFGWQGYGDVALAYLEALGKLLPGTPVLMASRWAYLDAVDPYLGSSLDKAAVGFLCKSSRAYVRSPERESEPEFDDPSVSELWRERIRRTIYLTWNVKEIPIPWSEGAANEDPVRPGRVVLVDVPEEPTLALLPEWRPPDQHEAFDDWAFGRELASPAVTLPSEARSLSTVDGYLRAADGVDRRVTPLHVGTLAGKLAGVLSLSATGKISSRLIALLAAQLSDKGGRYLLVPLTIEPESAYVAILVRAPVEHTRAKDYYEGMIRARLEAAATTTWARPRASREAGKPLRTATDPLCWFKVSQMECATVEPPSFDQTAPRWQLVVVFCKLAATMGEAQFPRALIHVFKDLHYGVVSAFGALSLFDILGPAMVGPSSSHTAGACRIGRLAESWLAAVSPWLEERGVRVARSRLDIVMHGSFRTTGEGHGSDLAVLSGLLGRLPFDPIVRLPGYGEDHSGTATENVRTWFGMPSSRRGDKEDGRWPDASARAWPPFVRLVWDNPGNATLHPNTIRVRVMDCEDAAHERELAWLTARSYGGGNVQVSGAGLWMRIANNEWRTVETDLREADLNDRKAKYGGLRGISVVDRNGHLELEDPAVDDALFTIQPTRMASATKGTVPKLLATLWELSNPPTSIALTPIWKQALEYEESVSSRPMNEVRGLLVDPVSVGRSQTRLEPVLTLRRVLAVMFQSIIEGLSGGDAPVPPGGDTAVYGATRRVPDHLMDALKIFKHSSGFDCLNVGWRAYAYSVGVQEQNARKGRIVAAPTAGACGIVPGALFGVAFSAADIEQLKNLWQSLEPEVKRSSPEAIWDRWRPDDAEHDQRLKRLEDALLTAAMVGLIINNIVPTSGSSHGCQAETGIGAAMAAAAVCAFLQSQSDPQQILHAATLALKNAIGLICDPVGGKVEVPCIKRSGMKAVEAVVAAHAALAGVTSQVEPDAVVWVLREAGEAMPPKFRETSLGGLAQTPCARCGTRIC